jgi:hypothetical protein
MDPPSHPESEDTATDRKPTTPVGWGTRIVVAVVIALVAMIVILHLTGVLGPGAHGLE